MPEKRQSVFLLTALAAVLAVAIFIIDFNLPVGVLGEVLYLAVVLVGWWMPKRRYVFVLAAVPTVLILFEELFAPKGSISVVYHINHALVLFAIWVTAGLLFVVKERTRAREESERRFRDMTEATSDWFWEMGPDLRFSYFSDSFLPIAGIDPGELIGKSRPEIAAAGEDTAKWRRHLDDLVNHHPFRDFEYELVRPDGTTQHIKISGKPVYGDDGEFKGFRGTGANITLQVEAERRALDAQRQLSDAIEGLSDGIVLYDADERFVMCNAKYRESRPEISINLEPGMPYEEILRVISEGRLGILEGVDEDNAEEWFQERLARFRNPGPPDVRHYKDGRWVSVQDYKTPDGGTLIIRTDITEQKEAEQRAEDAQRMLSDAIEGLSDGVVLYDADERFVMCNTVYRKVYAKLKDILVPGTAFEDIYRLAVKQGMILGVGKNDAKAGKQWVQQRLVRFRDPGPPEERQRPDGGWVLIQDYRTQDGGTFIIQTDITERKQAEEALRESEERLRMILESSPNGIAIISLETNKRLYVNPAMADLFGASSVEEMINADLASTYADPADLKRLRKGKGKNFITETEVERKRLDGSHWWCLLSRRLIEYEGQPALMGWHYDITERKKAEQTLRESEERLKAIIDTVPAVINVKDIKGRYLLSNRYHQDIYGLKYDEILGKTSHIISRKHGLKVRKMERAVVETGKALAPYDTHIIDAKGNQRNMLVSKAPLRNPSGEITGIVTTAFDITARKKTEEALRDEEERLRLILENVVMGVITIDEDGIIKSFNPAAEKIFGYSAKQVIGNNISMLMPEPYHSEHGGYLKKYFKTGKGKIIGIGREVEGLRKDGTVFPMELGVNELTIGGRRTFTGIIEDISERKQAEKALKFSEERFRDLAESASDWFWEMGPDLRFTYVSERFFELTGWQRGDIIGKERKKTADKESLKKDEDAWRRHQKDLKARRPFSNFVRSLPRNPHAPDEGERIFIRLSGKPRFGDDGEFLGYRGTAIDITRRMEAENEIRKARDELEERVAERTQELSEEVEERKRIEDDLRLAKEEAEFSDRAKTEFLANMSHELRTPLNSIIGFSDMLKSEILGINVGSKQQEYLNDINASGRHLLDLIKDILDVSKIEAGAMELADEQVDIGAAVGASLKMVDERAKRAGVTLHTDIPGDLPRLQGDSLRIKQILLNLIGNAVKFTPPEGNVTVRAGIKNGGGVYLLVEDTGIGIDGKDLERVTEPFTQAAGSQTRSHEGTGLGLALVKSLVEMHQGRLEIKSQPGKGTQVTVFFPKERTITGTLN